jgi:hypothetical protein
VPLELDGVKGGALAFVVPGTVEQVSAALLDFDHAAGHRSWAKRGYRTISRSPERVHAEWRFEGRMGMHPTIEVEFLPETDARGSRIRYRLVKKGLGIATFFGDYRLEPVAGSPARTRVTERVFLDSGLAFANASHEDLEKGLQEDARLLAAWMAARTGGSE